MTSPVNRKVCIITGGGRGIGRFTAEALARGGARLALLARTESELAETADSILRNGGARPLLEAVDVTDKSAVRRFAAVVTEVLGPPELVLNNAAMLGPVGPLVDADLDEWGRTLTVNVAGIANVCATFAPDMAKGGAIVNLSGGGLGGPGMARWLSAYTASKAAVIALTESLAVELAAANITVNAIAPGAAVTRFMEPVLAAGPDKVGELYTTTVAQREAPASLEPFVQLVEYLASEDGRWLTGRLLSARWDTIEALEKERATILAGSRLKLRRIDDALYRETSS